MQPQTSPSHLWLGKRGVRADHFEWELSSAEQQIIGKVQHQTWTAWGGGDEEAERGRGGFHVRRIRPTKMSLIWSIFPAIRSATSEAFAFFCRVFVLIHGRMHRKKPLLRSGRGPVDDLRRPRSGSVQARSDRQGPVQETTAAFCFSCFLLAAIHTLTVVWPRSPGLLPGRLTARPC